MIWIDVSDIREYLIHSRAVTGIQRVALNIIEPILKQEKNARLVIFDVHLRAFREISMEEMAWVPSSARLQSVAAVKSVAKMLPGSWRERIRDQAALLSLKLSRFKRVPCNFTPGDSFLFLGAFWQSGDHVNRLINVAFSNRIKLHVLIHDIIPITQKNWFSGDYASKWQDQLENLLRETDGIFVNSIATASALRRHLTTADIKEKSIKVLRFGDPVFTESLSPTKRKPQLATKRDFVLMVSSIDVRKNQTALLFVWNRLIKEYGDAIPDLVLVGKDATGNANIHAIVAQCKDLSKRVKFVRNADDDALAQYYENCLFTAFPSFAEGWGFPVAESLVFRKACIASNTTSIPEVGGTLCRYVNPYNLEDIYQAIEAFIFDGRSRDYFVQKIAAEYKRTTWESTAESVLETILAPRRLAGALAQDHLSIDLK